ELNQDDARYGFRCCHLKNIWTAPLPPETELSRQMTTSTTSIDIMGLQAAYATRKVSAEVDLVHQQTQNQRYGSSHIGATAKDISNVVTDAASGVVDIFHGIDKAVADTWNNFWKDGKA